MKLFSLRGLTRAMFYGIMYIVRKVEGRISRLFLCHYPGLDEDG